MPCCDAAQAKVKIAATRSARAAALAAVAKQQRTGVLPKPKKVPAKKVAPRKFKPSCTVCGGTR